VVESGRKWGKMPSFSGTYYFNVDPKGRVIIPAPLRELIGSNYSTKLYVTNAPADPCLRLYPLEEWNRLQEKARSRPASNAHMKFFMRRVIGGAVEVEIDKQGRIQIPVALRENAKIHAEIAIVGQTDRIEIWDRKEWDKAVDLSTVDLEAVERGLAALDL
jgi:MraZ protein